MTKLQIIKKFFEKKDYPKILILIMIMILANINDLLSIGLLVPITYTLFGLTAESTSNNFLIIMINQFISSHTLMYNLVFLSIVFGIKNILIFYFNKYRIDFFGSVYLKNSKKIFQNYLNQDYKNFAKKNIFSTNQNIITEVRTIIDRLFNPVVIVISEIVILLFLIVFLLLSNEFYVFYLLVIFILFGLFYNKLFGNYLSKLGETRRVNEKKSRQIATEGLSGFKEILILKKQSFFVNQFHKSAYLNVISNNFFSYLQIIPRVLIETLLVIIFTILIAVGLSNDNSVPINSIIILLVVSYRLMPIVNRLATNYNYIKFALPVLDHFKKEKIFSLKQNELNKQKNTVKKIKQIKFKNVYFKFLKKKHILKGLTVTIPANKIIGIYGKSGSGKTTFLNLLVGLLKPTKGKVLIDNVNLEEIDKEFQSNISYISQDGFLMDQSILVNILFDDPKSTKNQKRAILCLKRVELYDQLKKSNNDINTVIGEGGKKLSAGQKQKLLIARALYNNKKILVFDEATNNLDKKSEEEILKVLKKIKINKTIILISHDQNVIKICDKVIKFS